MEDASSVGATSQLGRERGLLAMADDRGDAPSGAHAW